MWKKSGELFDLQMGKTPSRDNSLYWHGNNKWVSIADLSKSGKFISETKETISDLGVTESGIKKVDKDTVIMSFKLSVGKSAITADDMYTNEAIMAFNDRNILPIDKEWLYYYLSNFDWSKTGNKAVKGITLNKAILKDISINVPDLSEQRKIVARLTRLDRLYDYFCQQIVNLDQLVKSRFIEMFADTPKGVLSDVATIKMGQSPDGKTYNDEGNGTAFYQGKTEFGDLYIGAPTTWTTAPTRFAEANDVLMSVRAPVGSTNIAVEQCCLGRGLAGIRPIEGKSTTMFILYSMRSIENQIEGMGVGSTFKAINKDQVYKLPIPIADLDKQARFVKIAEQSDKSKFEIQQSIEKLEILKKSLMQEYFG